MKPIFARLILLSIFAAFVPSCSKEDPSILNTVQNQLKIKKISSTVYNNGLIVNNQSIDFIYENNILIKVKNDAFETLFFYNGEKLIRTDSYFKNILSQSNSYNYSGNNLVSVANADSGSGITNYTYSAETLLTKQIGYNADGIFTSLGNTFYTYDTVGNLIEKLTFSSSLTSNSRREIFTYDSKNNPIKFMNRYVRFLYEDTGFGFDGLTVNNKLTSKLFQSSEAEFPEEYRYEIEYNTSDFPIEIKQIKTQANELHFVTNLEYY